MADIILSLGDFTFQDMEVPEVIPFHAKQRLTIHKMIGGVRQIDAMGSDPDPMTWSGVIFPTEGTTALDRARQLEAMLDAGQPVDLQWDEIFLSVYIADFKPDYRFARIPYTIIVEVLQDFSDPIGTNAAPDADDLIGNDLLSANTLTSSIGNPTLSGLMGTVTSAIHAASSVIAAAQGAVGSVVGTLGSVAGVTSLVGASPSVINSILGPVLAASSQVASMSSIQDGILAGALAPGGVVAGASVAANLASFAAISSASSSQVSLLQLGSVLGRMTTNLNQINSSPLSVTVSGGNLYDLAARQYGDPTAAGLIMQANGLSDPTIIGNTTLTIPPYVSAAVGGAISI